MANAAFQPHWFSKPGDTVSALMARQNLTAAALAERMGHEVGLIQGLFAGTVAIDDSIAAMLTDAVGGSPSFWIARQAQFDDALARAASAAPSDEIKSWLRTLPVKEMVSAGWIPASSDRDATARSLFSYFDVADLDEWRQRYTAFDNTFSFRTSPTYESKVGAMAAWLRQGEIEADAATCASWNAERFQDRLSDIRVLTKAKDPHYFMPRLRALCAEVGVAIVYVRAPTGCRASGATRFLSPTKAMIISSFRYLSDDQFWFTFFHEAGHLLLHGEAATFVDGNASDKSDRESEANAFSAGVLVPLERQQELLILSPRPMDVVKFAVSVGVSPGIVVGQMQHLRLIGPDKLNYLKRRYDWAQIQRAIA